MMFYTYLHSRASDNLPFYIGKGVGKRAWKTTKRNNHWNNVRAKHGVKVEIVAHWQTEQDALDHEKFLIWCFRDMGFDLANIAEGGQPGPVTRGMPKTDEHKAKIAAAHLGRPKRKHSAEARAKKSAAATGRVMPEEVRKKIGAANAGRTRTAETKALISLIKRNISQETREKMSASAKARCAKKASFKSLGE
jgi:hypothetical protein